MKYEKVIIKTAEQAAAEEAEKLEKCTCPHCGYERGESLLCNQYKCPECGTIWEVRRVYDDNEPSIIIEAGEPRKWWQFWKR